MRRIVVDRTDLMSWNGFVHQWEGEGDVDRVRREGSDFVLFT
jgi:hypothetical protein